MKELEDQIGTVEAENVLAIQKIHEQYQPMKETLDRHLAFINMKELPEGGERSLSQWEAEVSRQLSDRIRKLTQELEQKNAEQKAIVAELERVAASKLEEEKLL